MILFFPLGCIRNPATRKVHPRLLSPQAEKKIGIETKKKILEQYQVLNSTTVTNYVSQVGQRLASVCDRPTVDYDFTVLDNDLINAFAVPGGYVFVTRGLLESMNDESELAMVLGHEIAHIAALHGVQMIQKEMGQNALTILGTIGVALTMGPEAMLMVANTADLFSSLYMLGYSREKELESDNLGLQYMLRAGYDPQGSLRFLKTLQAMDSEESKGWDLYFRTHPSTDQRIRIIESMIGRPLPDFKPPIEDSYAVIKAQLPKVDQDKQGSISGLTYTNTFHEVHFHVPSNWNLDFVHSQALVSFRTLDGDGDGRLQVVDLSSMTITAENVAYKFSKISDFQFINGRDVLYQAGYGYLGRYYGISSSGKLLDIRLFATIRRGKGYVLLCGVPPEKADSYALDIEQILRALWFG
ncbi:MAG: Beta-barrel assembly-enhancing protease [Elusimicrobia bacterium]|nr:Beta-barrel assembly-enhancing protease [Elusimicrobiota bacterium]